MAISNFFDKNKGKILGSIYPGGNVAGTVYDYFNNRNKTQYTPTSTSWQGPVQPPKPTYNSGLAKTTVNNAKADLDAWKARQEANKSTFDPMALAEGLSKEGKKDEDGEEGPSPFEQYLREVQRIQAGKFKYSATEEKNLENLRATGRQAELRQSRVNENYMGGTLQGEQRSGRSRYAQEIADDAMINAMQTGVDQINELDLETQKAIVELENAIKEERLRAVAEQYGLLQEQDRQREDATQNIQKNLLEYQKLMATIQNQTRGSAENDYNLAISQGYTGTYLQFIRDLEGTKLAGKYAPQSRSNDSGGSAVADAVMAFANS